MNLMPVVSGWNRNWNLKKARAVFDRACELVGGEQKLAEVFKDKRAFTVSSQSGIVGAIASGVKPADLPTKAVTWNHAEVTKMRAIIGETESRAILKAAKGFYCVDQGIVLSRHALKNGIKVDGVDLQKYAAQKTRAEEAANPTQRKAVQQNPVAPAAAPSKPVTASMPAKPAVMTPANPTPAIASKPDDGKLSLAAARDGTRAVFGHVPAILPGQNERVQWAELTSMYRQSGHSAPWDDATSPDACTMAIHRSDASWITREKRIAKAFPGSAATTAKVVVRKVEPRKPQHGRERALAAMKIPK